MRNQIEEDLFINTVQWLHDVRASIGVDYVEVDNNLYWLTSSVDMERLFKLFTEHTI